MTNNINRFLIVCNSAATGIALYHGYASLYKVDAVNESMYANIPGRILEINQF